MRDLVASSLQKSRGLLLCCSIVLFCCSAVLAFAFKLPDTGQTKCYQAVSPYAEIPCADTGQDGEYNISPLSYTDNGGGTLTDHSTGLMWQQQDDGILHQYSSYACDGLTLGDYTDWRLPSKKELITIVDYSIPSPGPTIDSEYFLKTKSSDYWSSTEVAGTAGDFVWDVGFKDGKVYGEDIGFVNLYVRCVRGGEVRQSLIDNGDRTVTDVRTGLMWQQNEPGSMIWGAALHTCGDLTLANHTDWRLPNVKELESLTDDTAEFGSGYDHDFFPNAGDFYWSSTTDATDHSRAWSVRAWTEARGKDQGNYVRCVRGPVNSKPTVGSLIPSQKTSDAGVRQTFTAVYRDADGYGDLKTVDFLVSPTGSTANAIWARYVAATNELRLYNNSGSKLLAAKCTPGVAGTLQNSQGKIICGTTTVTTSGNNLTVKWRIVPKPAFAGAATPKKLKMKATDISGATSGWKVKGTWQILNQ